MSAAQTALVFAGIPIAVVALFAVMVFGPGEMRQPNRYRPGRPWTYPPVWYIPRPVENGTSSHAALESASRPALEAGVATEAGDAAPPAKPQAIGGASGEW
jgi:hypothetical protein